MTAAFPAPIALFAYRRPRHLQATLSALAENTLAKETAVTIFCDGPRSEADRTDVEAVRTLATHATGFRDLRVIFRDRNLGLARSLISGVTTMLAEYETVIVLEDDLLTSPFFLCYMNEALARYRDDPRVWCVHGYPFPVRAHLPETFFLRGAECWGWATWRRAWQGFQEDEGILLSALREKDLVRAFNLDGGYDYYGLLKRQAAGKVDSWAIRWRASAFVAGGLCLWPGRSLVQNIGHDKSGEHCIASNRFDSEISRLPLHAAAIPIKENIEARNVLKDFFIRTRPPLSRRISNLFNRYARRFP
jgi:hypothetical protein